MVRPEGVEPPTYGSVVRCSIQLSHGRICEVKHSSLTYHSKDRTRVAGGFKNPQKRCAFL